MSNTNDKWRILDIPLEEILKYEIVRRGWPRHIYWGWMQDVVSRYILWRSRRIKRRFGEVRRRLK